MCPAGRSDLSGAGLIAGARGGQPPSRRSQIEAAPDWAAARRAASAASELEPAAAIKNRPHALATTYAHAY